MSRAWFAAVAMAALLPAATLADEAHGDLAKQLANPISSLISVPLQNNIECCYGPENATRYTLNVQPVVPVSLGQDWTVIIRTIMPVIWEGETAPGAGDHFGLGDVTQSFFFSPRSSGGITWGVGPAFLWPVAGQSLGSQKWAAGPTFVALKQSGRLTVGMLANHLWSYAGAAGREEVSATFVQPFFAYVYPNSTTINITTESSYDWTHRQWTVPVIAGVSHVYKFGGQRVQMGLQGKIYAVSPEEGPEWGVRMVATLLFPK